MHIERMHVYVCVEEFESNDDFVPQSYFMLNGAGAENPIDPYNAHHHQE